MTMHLTNIQTIYLLLKKPFYCYSLRWTFN